MSGSIRDPNLDPASILYGETPLRGPTFRFNSSWGDDSRDPFIRFNPLEIRTVAEVDMAVVQAMVFFDELGLTNPSYMYGRRLLSQAFTVMARANVELTALGDEPVHLGHLQSLLEDGEARHSLIQLAGDLPDDEIPDLFALNDRDPGQDFEPVSLLVRLLWRLKSQELQAR